MKFITGYCTDKGIKKEINQDALLIKTASASIGDIAFLAICDGMGGLQKGEMASSMMIMRLGEWFKGQLPIILQKKQFAKIIFESWHALIHQTNQDLLQYGREHNIKLGTTLTAMLIIDKQYFVAHVGDTRLYEITDAQAVQITKDHTFVAREVALQRMTMEEAEKDSRKNLLLQCIGASPKLMPDYMQGDVKENASYMICCDGFRHKLSTDEIKAAFTGGERNVQKLNEECRRLVNLNMERRETDNITVVALQMDVSQTETEKLLDKGQMTERLNASAQTTEKLNAGENI